MSNNSKKIKQFFDLGIIIFLLLLPYWIFAGKFFIGGDDTRLYYIYSRQWLFNISFYSWFNLSSLSINSPQQFMFPFTIVWSLINEVIHFKLILDYLSFSSPLIIGFIYFKILFHELVHNHKAYGFEIDIGALLFLMAPILFVNQLSIFLNSVWLICIIPVISYYIIRYLKTGNILYVFINYMFCVFFSLGIFALPWILGFLMPLFISLLLIYHLYRTKSVYIKRIFIFCFSILFSQSFWLLPAVFSYLFSSRNNVGGEIFSTSFLNSFTGTVLSTASGNIIYPLLNLFHRQIAFDYSWPLKYVFINFYDKVLFINLIFVFIIFVGIVNTKKLFNSEKIIYKLILLSFIFSLFFFTVNIGPLKYAFLLFGNIPGFVMFRNFYDKFALGFVVFYAALITFSLIIIARSYPRIKNYIFTIFLVVLIVNIIPIKQIINKPLWTTNNEYTTVNLSNEYLNFVNQIQREIQPTSNILEIPFNNAAYAIIKDDNSNNAYVGTSPMKVFTGINDFSGDLSFNVLEAQRINSDINTRNYKDLNKFMYDFNIDYVLLTKNIPNEIKQSYLFNSKDLAKQDSKMISSITNGVILKSEFGNYILYSAKQQKSLFSASNIKYVKINPTMYRIYFSDLKGKEKLVFNDAYNNGWKLYMGNLNDNCFPFKIFSGNIIECKGNEVLLKGNELTYLVSKNLFSNSHLALGDYSNDWVIDANYIKGHFNKNDYTINKDGSLNFELTLYFYPQLYFYIGSIISSLSFISICLLLFKKFYERDIHK